jgi:hypothetical protein
MVHDEKVTVPPKTETPPPCKHKRETYVKIPLGVGENIRSLRIKDVLGSMSAVHPMRAMGKFQVSAARTNCSSSKRVGRNFACENRGKRVSGFPIGAMVIFEVSVARTYCS